MSPRPRKQGDKLPKYVYRGKSAYEYRPEPGVYIKLAKLTVPLSEVWAKYEELQERGTAGNVRALIELFIAHLVTLGKPENTLKDYRQSSKKLIAVFGNAAPDSVTAPHVRKYMDLRGKVAKVRANREHSLLSAAFSFGIERGLAQNNPCANVKKYTEKPRDRYIEEWEYDAVYKIAPRAVQVAMELAHLCAMRRGDILKLAYEDCKEDGIYVKQGKTGKAQIKAWTPRLRAAIESSKELKRKKKGPQVFSRWVVSTKRGTRYTASGFSAIWQATINEAMDRGLIKTRYTFHDIKAKSISDYSGNKQRFAGHATPAQTDSYDRKTQVVESLDKK